MKITKVETIVLNMPMIIEGAVVPTPMGAPRTSMEMLLVRVDTDEGVTGWGEGFGMRVFATTRTAIDTIIGPMCIGQNPTELGALVGKIERSIAGLGRNGPAMYGLSAIDIALWDIAGKVAGLPIYQLLGGLPTKKLPAYASLLHYGDVEAIGLRVRLALSRGYRHIKLHETTIESIRAARDAAGPDIPIMVDCNCPWTVDEAIAMAQTLKPLDLMFLEEPVWPPDDHAGLAKVRQQGTIATAAGENASFQDFKSMLEAGSITYAQPSIAKVGGVTQMCKVMALAQTFGIEVMPHSAYFGPGLLATIHCVAALPGKSLIERFDCDFAVTPMHDAIDPDFDGCLAVPQGPGLGMDPDLAVIQKLRVA